MRHRISIQENLKKITYSNICSFELKKLNKTTLTPKQMWAKMSFSGI